MNNTAMTGSKNAKCSEMRRIGTDQLASNKWWISTKNIAPRQMLRKNMNASRYEYANCFTFTTAAIRPTITPTTIKMTGRFRAHGGIVSLSTGAVSECGAINHLGCAGVGCAPPAGWFVAGAPAEG